MTYQSNKLIILSLKNYSAPKSCLRCSSRFRALICLSHLVVLACVASPSVSVSKNVDPAFISPLKCRSLFNVIIDPSYQSLAINLFVPLILMPLFGTLQLNQSQARAQMLQQRVQLTLNPRNLINRTFSLACSFPSCFLATIPLLFIIYFSDFSFLLCFPSDLLFSCYLLSFFSWRNFALSLSISLYLSLSLSVNF